MDKYVVKLYTRAYRDLDDIYTYIGGNYRQLFVKNYCIIYRLMKKNKEVHIVTVRYMPSNF